MLILNVMYFALGFLAAGLFCLMIMPSIWRRAVRLTKTRIEAATPITMSELRADKDQLRAEFALSTRRLEKNVEILRARLANQLSDINTQKSELTQLKSERDQQFTIVHELEERETSLRKRILELEKEGANLAQQLRMRDRELDKKTAQLEAKRNSPALEERSAEVGALLGALQSERAHSIQLENQALKLLEELETAQADSSAAKSAVAEMRRTLAARDDERTEKGNALLDAEGRIAAAENRLNAILHDEYAADGESTGHTGQLLAEKLSLEAELEDLRQKVLEVENAVHRDWDVERMEHSHLRERLNDIASDVSKLVYAVDGDSAANADESLFDRVRRYADDGLDIETIAANRSHEDTASIPHRRGNLEDRMAALRDLQAR